MDGAELTPDEHEQLAKCDECRWAMVENTSKEFDKRHGTGGSQ
jgi:hypothetical protein